jgi:hypothetical protein
MIWPIKAYTIAVQRKHSDVLIAVLIVVGAMMSVAMAAHRVLPAFNDLTRLIVVVVSAFGAAQVSRRLLINLELGGTVLAALIAIALSLGIFAHRRYVAIEPAMAIPFGAAGIGALVGALTSRRRNRDVRGGWRVIGAGLAGFGAALLTGGVVVLLRGADSMGLLILAMFIGGALGPFFVALNTGADYHQCGQGVTLVFVGVSLTVAAGIYDAVVSVLGGVMIGALAGAIGGGIGACVRRSRESTTTLPEAQVQAKN